MTKTLFLLAAAAVACASHAGDIRIRGIRIGMTVKEFDAAYPKGVEPGFAIAGANTRSGFAPPAVQFRNGKLEQFSAYFAGQDFERIRSAVVAKNPSVQCTAKERFAVCHDDEGGFVLTRSGSTTLLLLQSRRLAAEAQRALVELLPEGDSTGM